jgi:hypothetical protein
MKTAVQWLEEKLKESLGEDFDAVRGYFVMAKDVEKEQITEAFINGEVARDRIDSMEYYLETYGNENK